MSDKYSALWVSHSTTQDFLNCPRGYYLKNVYKDPKTGNKITLISPPLALGKVIHEVVESLSTLPVEKRLTDPPLMQKFNKTWNKISGKKGGFTSESQEKKYKKHGKEMIQTILKNPGPIKRLAVKIKTDLPNYWLSKEDNIILCGKIDWLEYLKDQDAVHIIDFKTGKNKESKDSLQLPIYYLIARNTQKRPVKKASYWYLNFSDKPQEQPLPDADKTKKKILKLAKKIKLARALERFKCPEGKSGCRACKPYERIIEGEGEHVGQGGFGKDVYILPKNNKSAQAKSEVL